MYRTYSIQSGDTLATSTVRDFCHARLARMTQIEIQEKIEKNPWSVILEIKRSFNFELAKFNNE